MLFVILSHLCQCFRYALNVAQSNKRDNSSIPIWTQSSWHKCWTAMVVHAQITRSIGKTSLAPRSALRSSRLITDYLRKSCFWRAIKNAVSILLKIINTNNLFNTKVKAWQCTQIRTYTSDFKQQHSSVAVVSISPVITARS